MVVRAPTSHETAARAAVLSALRPYADEIGPQAMLAVLAYTLGQMVAMQDQRGMSPEVAMAIVSTNLQRGNQDAIDALVNATGGHA